MRFFTAGLTVLWLCLAASCNKPDPQPDPVFPANTFTATVDGKAFYAGDISVTESGGGLAIVGVRNAGTSKASTISLSIAHYIGLATYVINTATAASYSEPGTTYNAASGTIIIATDNDVHIAGTFSFETSTGAVSKIITNGSFDVYK